MESTQVIFFVIFVSALLLTIAFFFWLVLITQRKRANLLYQEKIAMQEAFEKQLLHSQLEIQEQTFSYISQEIHDNVGQILSLAKVQLNIMDEGDLMEKPMLRQAKDHISRAMGDLRDIARGMNTGRLEEESLEKIVAEELDRINKTGYFKAAHSLTGVRRELSPQKKLILFRVIQESLQNIIKHAHASEVYVLLHYREEQMEVSVGDNGKGFVVNDRAENCRQGSGLFNIRQRTSLIGGIAIIDSSPEKGTLINIKVPYA